MYLHGIEQIELADAYLSEKRVGLLTNYSGLDRNFRRSADLLAERYHLTKLFAPEHGIYGVAQAGEEVKNIIDAKTNLPVYSMFGELDKTESNFSDLDVMAFDIQDIGVRFYTYTSVMAIAMKACAKIGIPMVVFDRYNPLGLEEVSGSLLDEKFSSFIGMYAIPSRHGMTVGEYARFINEQKNIHCELHVIPCADLDRKARFPDLNLPWVLPSPNIPTYTSALVFAGTVLFEDSNVSEGRGTTKPFELIGAPWIDSDDLATRMNSMNLPGVRFRAAAFCPTFSKYKGEACYGVQIHITDEKTFEPFSTGLILIDEIRKNYPEFNSPNLLRNHLGTDAFFASDFDVHRFIESESVKIARFIEKTKKYRLY